MTVSLSGFINYLDVNNPEKPLRVVKGHNKPITVLGLSEDRAAIFTGSHDGYVTRWNAETGENERIEGVGHGNQINGLKAHENTLYTCGIDDSLKQIDIEGSSVKNVTLKKLKCHFFRKHVQTSGFEVGLSAARHGRVERAEYRSDSKCQ